eukprot:g6688.t1
MDLEDPIVSTLASLLILIDLFWLFDIVLNFTTGVRDSVQVLHYDVKSIASAPDIPRIIWWLSLSPMLRAPRLWTSIGTLRRMEAHLKSSWLSSVAALVELFMLPVVFSHISAACLALRSLEPCHAMPHLRLVLFGPWDAEILKQIPLCQAGSSWALTSLTPREHCRLCLSVKDI